MMRRWLCGLLVFLFTQSLAVAQSQPEEVVFPSAGQQLHGFPGKPDGAGPFPAGLWNHGSEKFAGRCAIRRSYCT